MHTDEIISFRNTDTQEIRDREFEYLPPDSPTAGKRDAVASGRLRRPLALSRHYAGPFALSPIPCGYYVCPGRMG